MKIALNAADATLGSIKVDALRDIDDPAWRVDVKIEIPLVANATGEVIDLAEGALSKMAKEARRIQDDQSITLAVAFGALEWVWTLEQTNRKGLALRVQGGSSGRTKIVLKPGESPKLQTTARMLLDLEQLAILMRLSMEQSVLVSTQGLQTDIEDFYNEHNTGGQPLLLEGEVVDLPVLVEPEYPEDVA